MSLNIWQNCLQHLERELPADDFNTWVGPLQIQPGKGRTVLLAPNQYVRDYIALNYLERIRDIFEHLGSARESVVVDISRHQDMAVPPSAAPPPRTRVQSGLDKRYRFNNFVLGKSNELACAAAIATTPTATSWCTSATAGPC